MKEQGRLSRAESDAIYERRLRVDFLEHARTESRPIALFVIGQPGAGVTFAVERARAKAGGSAQTAVVVSQDAIREYHPFWRDRGYGDLSAAARVEPDVDGWYDRLVGDVIAKRANLVIEARLSVGEKVSQVALRAQDAGYTNVATIVAADRDESRIATLVAFDELRRMGTAARFVTAVEHDDAFDRVRTSVESLEADHSVDALRIITRAGHSVFRTQLRNGAWEQEGALAALDAVRNRPLTARELADNALRWQTVVQRLSVSGSIQREVLAQANRWQVEATERAERDPEARTLMQWGREAEAFRRLSHSRFLSEFPHHAKVVDRFRLAIDHFESEYGNPYDRDRTIAVTRLRLADRIAEGRYAAQHPSQAGPENDELSR